jgi:hypothetical protein
MPNPGKPGLDGAGEFFSAAIFRGKSGERGAVSLAPAGHPRHLAVPRGLIKSDPDPAFRVSNAAALPLRAARLFHLWRVLQ